MQYTPNPTRVWSRVQNQCNHTTDNTYSNVFLPLTNKTVPSTIANYQEKQLYKGNILQYKKNSSNLTKNQKFAQISKGCWANRTKTFATQSQTYSNPNTTGLQRVNYTTFPYPNNIVGAPNNVSGPFQYNVPNPDDCSSNSVQSGGSLICNKYANPCTGEIIKQTQTIECYPTSCSDVPGQIQDLCWDNRLQTYYPRQRYFMSNSGSKWPEGYKGFVSAVVPVAPVVVVMGSNSCSVTLSWTDSNNNVCLPISTYKIYVLLNNVLIKVLTVFRTVTTTTIYGLEFNTQYSFYVAAFSTAISSNPSNTVTALTSAQPSLVAPTALTIVSNVTGCSVSLSWIDSNNDICIPVTSYNIYIHNANNTIISSQSVPAPTTNAIVTGLEYETQYSFTVDAESDAESTPVNSPQSSPFVTITTPNTLSTPTLVSAVLYCYYITLSWTYVSNNIGCTNVDSYLIYIYGNPNPVKTVSYTTTTTDIDLSYNTQYDFYVVAQSGQALSPPSNSMEAVTQVIPVPFAPQLTTLTIDVTNTTTETVTLTWTDVSNNDLCFPITQYDIYQNGMNTTTVQAPTLTCDISNVLIDTQYDFYVTAYSLTSNLYSAASSTLSTPMYWYLDNDTLKCAFDISLNKITTQTQLPSYTVQPTNAWTLNSSGILTTSYDVVVSRATIHDNGVITSNTNYWYFTDANETSIYTNYPINAVSINVP